MLRIGKVYYLNTIPLFEFVDCGFVELVEGSPSELVHLLRKGEIDGGIVSSVEYFLNGDNYCVLPDISISSKRKICSVMIFSKKPLWEVGKFFITPESLTSRIFSLYLLSYIYGVKVEEVKNREEADAILLIGDDALSEMQRGVYPFVYDLAEEWYRIFKLPFIFALFLFRKDIVKSRHREIHIFKKQVIHSIRKFYNKLRTGEISFYSDHIGNYFLNCIDYTLTDEHKKSLLKLRDIVRLFQPIREKNLPCTWCL